MTDNVADLGEFGLIEAIVARLPSPDQILLGPGDDAAIVAVPDGRVVASTDLLIERNHFRRDWSSGYDVGRKAAAQNMADIAAMGARPTALLVGLGAPGDLPAKWVMELADGLRDEGAPFGVTVAGGDVVRSETIMISVTALGDLEGRDPVTRSGARGGDVLAVCGRLGWSAAGFAVLSRGFRSPKVLVEAHRRPDVPYEAGIEAAELGATAMCDISDGLLADAGHIASASDVAIDVDPDVFEIPTQLRDTSRALGADPLRWILTGAEDHALLATFPASVTLPERWLRIGAVSAGTGVTVGGSAYEGEHGHDHFGPE